MAVCTHCAGGGRPSRRPSLPSALPQYSPPLARGTGTLASSKTCSCISAHTLLWAVLPFSTPLKRAEVHEGLSSPLQTCVLRPSAGRGVHAIPGCTSPPSRPSRVWTPSSTPLKNAEVPETLSSPLQTLCTVAHSLAIFRHHHDPFSLVTAEHVLQRNSSHCFSWRRQTKTQ